MADFKTLIKKGASKVAGEAGISFDTETPGLSFGDRFGFAERGDLEIERFKSRFDSGARPNRYKIGINCPKLGIKFDGIRAISASLPGRSLEVQEFSEYGPTRKMPFNVNNGGGQISLSFLCDSTFLDRFLIEAWQSFIFAPSGSDVPPPYVSSTHDGTSVNPLFAYYYDYVGEMTIAQLSLNGDSQLEYKMHEVYPLSFEAQELSYESTDQIMKFECAFAYRTFETTYTKPSEGGGFLNGINKGRKALDIFGKAADLLGKGSDAKNISRYSDRLSRISGIFG